MYHHFCNQSFLDIKVIFSIFFVGMTSGNPFSSAGLVERFRSDVSQGPKKCSLGGHITLASVFFCGIKIVYSILPKMFQKNGYGVQPPKWLPKNGL